MKKSRLLPGRAHNRAHQALGYLRGPGSCIHVQELCSLGRLFVLCLCRMCRMGSCGVVGWLAAHPSTGALAWLAAVCSAVLLVGT